ncbi:DegT/DnrJ/EryC1/StrS family aminotransferase [candidate division KSB1 bacterium]|nr:DegT/DnrJ/EryC1/StrS family aminotransferase [candidate division KSB1 bacterium]
MSQKFRVPFGTMSITSSAKEMIAQALDDGKVTSGGLVGTFEKEFAKLMGVSHAVAVSTGTDADTLALATLHDRGARRGDEVIVPALSFVATGNAVVHAGFTPVFVDIEYDTLNINVHRLELAITERTRAIMPVHLMGKPAAMNEIMDIAKRYNLMVIEDAAEAHGATYHDRIVGSIGHMGAFSLYAAHIISTIEGGIITTNDAELAEIIRSLRAHGRGCVCQQCVLSSSQDYCAKRFRNGMDTRFTFPRIGYSSKMNELEAAVGLGNLAQYENILQKRRANLLHVLQRFHEFHPYLTTITEADYEQIGPHAIPIIVSEKAPFSREDLATFLEHHGIETRTLFMSMPTQCPGFAYLNYKLGQFPVAEFMGRNGLHIGVHQDLKTDDMEYVLEMLDVFIKKHNRTKEEIAPVRRVTVLPDEQPGS